MSSDDMTTTTTTNRNGASSNNDTMDEAPVVAALPSVSSCTTTVVSSFESAVVSLHGGVNVKDDHIISSSNNNKDPKELDSFYTNFHEGCKYLHQRYQYQRNQTMLSSSDAADATSVVLTAASSAASSSSSAAAAAAALPPPTSVLPDFLSHVTVSFIDPTTSSIMMSSNTTTSTTSASISSKPSSVGYSAAVKKAKLNQSIQLYEKFQRIFTTHYQSCLYNVPYQLFRNTMLTGEIPILPIRTVVTRGHGGFIVTDDTTSTSSTSSSSSPSSLRWNTSALSHKVHGDFSWEQPYCYVYLAACESLEHYRTKVKPSIQVFISQLEAAIKASASSSSALSRFRRSRSNPVSSSTADNATTTSNKINNDTSFDESINGSGGLDVSTSKPKKNKRIPPAPRYVIIYVPTGNNNDNINDSISAGKPGTSKPTTSNTSSSISSTTTSAIGASVVSRFAAARQRMTSAVAVGRNNSNNLTQETADTTGDDSQTVSTTTTADANNTITDDELLGPSNPQPLLPSAAIQQLNRVEREIARRFVNDFPAGNVCTLSTLFDATPVISSNTPIDNNKEDEESHHNATAAPPANTVAMSENIVQQLEWQAVLKAMGNAIMASFHDRCQRYDDEIRLIDHKRRGAIQLQQQQDALISGVGTPTKQQLSSSNNDGLDESTNGGTSVDDFHLCHFFLLKENLAFTYEQMRLPSEALLQYEELRAFLPDRNETKQEETLSSIISAMNDSIDDSKNLNRNELIDLALRGNILEFRRLLKMHGDVTTIQEVADEYLFAREIALLFQMQKSVRIMLRCFTYVQSAFAVKKRQIDEMDISEAYRQKLIELYQWAFSYCWYIKSGSDCLFADASMAKLPDYIACARCVCDILEFARNCFECFGDLVLSQSDIPLRPYGQGFVKSQQHSWTPWQFLSNLDTPKTSPVRFASPKDFLENAITSRDTFTDRYCDMLDKIATCHEYCGRRRYAARLRIERVDILDAKGDKANAANEILSIFTLYRSDQWNACYFALLLRMAGFQRVTVTPSVYLDTLVRCFYRGVHDIAPPKALAALHTDLLSVIEHESVKGKRYAAASLFGPSFGLDGMASSGLPGSDRSLLKKLYTLGDTIRVGLALNCYLFKDVEVDSISINLVPFPKYVAAMEDNVPISKADIHHAITFFNVVLSSGVNEINGEWQPTSSGQFIIASVLVVWRGVEFTYSAKEIRRPTIRIDVVACAPSQTLDITPKFLLAEQEQPIQVELHANKDCVIDGTLLIQGPANTLFRHHGSDSNDTNEWVSSLEIAITSCDPGQKVSHMVYVKISTAEDSEPSKQIVRCNLITSYKHAIEDVGATTSETMQASLDASVEIFDKSVFTVHSSDLISYSNGKAVINAVLECNCATNLKLKNWSIDLPSCYALANNGDKNDSLANETVSHGDRLSLTFDCIYVANAIVGSTLNSKLHINFENEMGAQLHESLKLRLKSPMDVALNALDADPSTVKIHASVQESIVGLPVEIIYSIALGELNTTSEIISYEIATDHADWMLNGKTIGILSATSNKPCDVTIIAIPIRPGTINEYPSLSLKYLSDTGTKTMPISVAATETFTSLSPPDHTSVAFFIGRATSVM